MTMTTPQFFAEMPPARAGGSEAGRKHGRRLPLGVGLGIGLLASLGLWAGIAYVAVRLVG